jgi:hypothetical protein
LYNWAICEDLKLKKEEAGEGEEGELYTQRVVRWYSVALAQGLYRTCIVPV